VLTITGLSNYRAGKKNDVNKSVLKTVPMLVNRQDFKKI